MTNLLSRSRERVRHFLDRPNHTPKRVLNKLVSVASQPMHPTYVPAYPDHVQIEPTTACQLKCPLCPVGNGTLARPAMNMQFSTFQRVVDDIGKYVYHINFNGSGDPLLNRDIFRMIRYAREANIYTDLYTNFQYRDQRMIEQIPTSELSRILISLDGTTKEIYEAYRIKGQFERILQNVETLVARRNKEPDSGLQIDLQFVVMRQNEHQLSEIGDVAVSLGVDNLVVKRTFLFQGTTGSQEETLAYLPQGEGLSLYNQNGLTVSWKGELKRACDVLWGSTTILCDGSVSPCCFDYHGDEIFGNVNEEKLSRIWNGAKYRAFRARTKHEWEKIKLCTSIEGGCPEMYVNTQEFFVPIALNRGSKTPPLSSERSAQTTSRAQL